MTSDMAGTQYHVSKVAFAEIDAWARAAFGAPKVSEEANLDGFPHRVWTANQVGVAIQLIGGRETHHMILLKPITP